MSVNNAFILGDIARVSITIKTLAALSPADPGGLAIKVKKPDNTLSTLTYGIDADIVKDAVGNYHADIALSQSGVWHWRWEATGTNAGVAEGSITVKPSQVI